MIENCKSLTTFLNKLRNEFAVLGHYLGSEQYEKTQLWVERIDSIIAGKKEFFQFLGFEVESRYGIEEELIKEGTPYLREGFWPVQLAGNNKDKLVFCKDPQTVAMMDIDGGSGWSSALPVLGTERSNLLGYFFANQNGIYIRVSSEFGPLLNFMSNVSGTINLTKKNPPPEVFCGDYIEDKMIGSVDGQNLCTIKENSREIFDLPGDRPPVKIKTMELSLSARFTYTMSEHNVLEWWDNEKKSYGGHIHHSVIDYQPISGERLLYIFLNKILIFGPNSRDFPVATCEGLQGYWKLAVDPEEKYLYALTGAGKIDVFRMVDYRKVACIDVSKDTKGNLASRAKFFDVGEGGRIVIGLEEGDILIMGSRFAKIEKG